LTNTAAVETTTATPGAAGQVDPPGQVRRPWRGIADADFAPIPVLIALILICVVFQSQNDKFLSPENLSNLLAQIAATGLIATGVVLVLLIGEIDLSVGIVSGLAAAVAVVLNVESGVPGVPSMAIGLAVGAGVGLVTGLFVTKFHVPSFVVTLAGLLGWQGAMLAVLGTNGSVNVADDNMLKLASTYYADSIGWVLAAAAIGGYAASVAIEVARRRKGNLSAASPRRIAFRIVAVAATVLAIVAILNSDRGVPLSLLILVLVVVLTDLMTRKTVFGRHIFAVGGNVEAARRAGIHVDRVKILVFVLASTLAAAGGLLAAGRLLTVTSGSGGGDLLLNAIAAAVIGGTSLFGGRGSAWAALLGALVIGAISNGMDLLSVQPSTKFAVTGAVLLAAVTVDAVTRRRYRAGTSS
jgi:D-xylose transport system permease protein